MLNDVLLILYNGSLNIKLIILWLVYHLIIISIFKYINKHSIVKPKILISNNLNKFFNLSFKPKCILPCNGNETKGWGLGGEFKHHSID